MPLQETLKDQTVWCGWHPTEDHSLQSKAGFLLVFFSEGSLGILFRAFKCRLSLYCPGHLYVGCPGTVRDTYMPAVLVLVPIGYVYHP